MARSAIERFIFGREAAETRARAESSSGAILVGRIFLATIFVISGIAKIFGWAPTLAFMEAKGFAAAPVFLVFAIVIEIIAGLSVMTGTFTRLGALVLFIYLVPVTLTFHNFWAYSGVEQQAQMATFFKNLSIMGGLLLLIGYGAHRLSVDKRLEQRMEERGEAPQAPQTPSEE